MLSVRRSTRLRAPATSAAAIRARFWTGCPFPGPVMFPPLLWRTNPPVRSLARALPHFLKSPLRLYGIRGAHMRKICAECDKVAVCACPGEIPLWCCNHAPEHNAAPVKFSAKCQAPGCSTSSSYGHKNGFRLWCGPHGKERGAARLGQQRSKCGEPGCGRWAVKVGRCTKHLPAGTKTCRSCKAPGCMTLGSITIPGVKGRWCKTHGLERGGLMVPLYRMCGEPGCTKHSTTCLPGGALRWCVPHGKKHGAAKRKTIICSEPGCTKNRNRGKWCHAHGAAHGATVRVRFCEEPRCTKKRAVRQWCRAHAKKRGVITSTLGPCNTPGCKNSRSARGYCRPCKKRQTADTDSEDDHLSGAEELGQLADAEELDQLADTEELETTEFDQLADAEEFGQLVDSALDQLENSTASRCQFKK